MATVSRETAEREIVRCRRTPRPRMFCIASYVHDGTGQTCYKLCYTAVHFVDMMTSPFVGRVIILWKGRAWERDYDKLVAEAHRALGLE